MIGDAINPDLERPRGSKSIQARILNERGLLVNRVVFAARSAIEKTSSGKKRRRIIRERFLRQELTLLES